jgi:hypothetical protein
MSLAMAGSRTLMNDPAREFQVTLPGVLVFELVHRDGLFQFLVQSPMLLLVFSCPRSRPTIQSCSVVKLLWLGLRSPKEYRYLISA